MRKINGLPLRPVTLVSPMKTLKKDTMFGLHMLPVLLLRNQIWGFNRSAGLKSDFWRCCPCELGRQKRTCLASFVLQSARLASKIRLSICLKVVKRRDVFLIQRDKGADLYGLLPERVP
jgi:hypothetical protein